MECKIVSLDSQTWRIEEFDAANSVYLYLLAGTEKALLIDTGFGEIDLPAAVRSLTPLPVEVVNTHGHFDHIGGNGAFDQVRLHRADEALYHLHRQQQGKPMTETLVWMEEGDVFHLGGRDIEVIHAPGHSLGSVCLLDRARRWLFTGDTCCKADVLLCLPYCTTVAEYAATVEKLQGLRDCFDVTWPAHHAVPVSPDILDQFAAAADLLLRCEDLGQPMVTPFGTFPRLAYRDVGIVYKDEALPRDPA